MRIHIIQRVDDNESRMAEPDLDEMAQADYVFVIEPDGSVKAIKGRDWDDSIVITFEEIGYAPPGTPTITPAEASSKFAGQLPGGWFVRGRGLFKV